MRFRISLLHRSISYWMVLGLFVVANGWSWLRYRWIEHECCDPFIMTIGFPFPYLVKSDTAGSDDFLVTGLLLDIVIAWTLATCAAWIGLLYRGSEAAPR